MCIPGTVTGGKPGEEHRILDVRRGSGIVVIPGFSLSFGVQNERPARLRGARWHVFAVLQVEQLPHAGDMRST
jgi:hypothetical protein